MVRLNIVNGGKVLFVLEENHYGAFSASCRNRGKAQTVNGNFVLLLVGETYKQEIIEGMTHLLLGWSSDVYINTIFTDATGGNINDRIASVQTVLSQAMCFQ